VHNSIVQILLMNIFRTYKSNLFLNLLLVYIVWGSTYLGVKIGIKELSPMFLTSLRFLGGGVLLFIFTLIVSGLPKFKEAKGSIFIGILLTGFGTTAVSYGIKYIPSGVVALLVALLPIWTFLLDFFFFSKKGPSKLAASGMLLGLCGVLLLFNPFKQGDDAGLTQVFPILVIFLGSIAWGLGSLLTTRVTQSKGLTGVSLQMMAGGSVALLASFIFENNHIESLKIIHLETIGALTYLILIGSYVGYTAYIWLINNAPPLLTSSYAYANPVVAMILGYYLADEELSTMSAIAGVLILVGVVFMTLGRKKKGEF
jgi:drug/metabolite transporter (DMT)-like permease